MKLLIEKLQPGMQIKINEKTKDEKNYLVFRGKPKGKDEKGELYLVEAVVVNKNNKHLVGKELNLKWPSNTPKLYRTNRYFDYSTVKSVAGIENIDDFLINAVEYRSAKDNKKWYENNENKINEQCKKNNNELVKEDKTEKIETKLPSSKILAKDDSIAAVSLKQKIVSTSQKEIKKNKDEENKNLYYQQLKIAIQKEKFAFLKPSDIKDNQLKAEIQAELETKISNLAKTIHVENLPENFNKAIKLEFVSKKSFDKKRNEASEIGGSEQELTFNCTIADKTPFPIAVRASVKVSYDKTMRQVRGWYNNIIETIDKFKKEIKPIVNTFDEDKNVNLDKDFRELVGNLKDLYAERKPYLKQVENDEFKVLLENCKVLKNKIDNFIDFVNRSDRKKITVLKTHLEQLAAASTKFLDNDLPEFVKKNIIRTTDFDELVKVISNNHDNLHDKLEYETKQVVEEQNLVNKDFKDIKNQIAILENFYKHSCSKKISFWQKICFNFKKYFFTKNSKFKKEQAKRITFITDYNVEIKEWKEKEVANKQLETAALPKVYTNCLKVDSLVTGKANSAPDFDKKQINKQEIGNFYPQKNGNTVISHL